MKFTYGKRKPRVGKRANRRMPKVSFKDKVLKALSGVRELKVAKLSQLGLGIGPTMIVPYQLMPNVTQGTSSHAQRIGNSITLKKIIVKGWIQIPSLTSHSGDTEHLSRTMILRQRNMSGSNIIANPADFQTNDLMEYDQPYLGTPNNWLQSVNKDAFVCRRDKKSHYSVTANYQGPNTQVPNPDSIKFFSMTLTFGKQGKKLDFSTDTASQSQNFPYFLTSAIHQTDGNVTAGSPSLNLYTEAYYYDN